MRARRLTTLAVLVVLGVLGACGGSSSSSDPRDPAPAAGEVSPLAFTSAAVGGGTVEGAAFQGRPTLLWFWAPW